MHREIMCRYEDAFKQSDTTDAVLVIMYYGKKNKLHVNKAFLSYHSDYFNTLFNSEFKEKSMEEIEIKDVNFYHFATVLSLVHPNPITPSIYQADELLTMADRFLLPSAKNHLEMFLLAKEKSEKNKVMLGVKFGLMNLLDSGIKDYSSNDTREFRSLRRSDDFVKLPESTKVDIFTRYLNLRGY